LTGPLNVAVLQAGPFEGLFRFRPLLSLVFKSWSSVLAPFRRVLAFCPCCCFSLCLSLSFVFLAILCPLVPLPPRSQYLSNSSPCVFHCASSTHPPGTFCIKYTPFLLTFPSSDRQPPLFSSRTQACCYRHFSTMQPPAFPAQPTSSQLSVVAYTCLPLRRSFLFFLVLASSAHP